MLRYIAQSAATSIVLSLFATLVVFLIASLVPGDPILAMLGDLAASKPDDRRRVPRQVGPRSAAVGAVLDLPEAAVPRRPRHLDQHRTAGARRHRAIRAGDDRARHHRVRAVGRRSACRSASSPPCGATAGSITRALHLADRRFVAGVLARLHRADGVLRLRCRSRRARAASIRSTSRRRR